MIWVTEASFCVDTIVDMLEWRPRVKSECNTLLWLEKLGSSEKSSTIINIDYDLCKLGFSYVI